MKKYFFSAAFIVFLHCSHAQEIDKVLQFGLGITPGVVLGGQGTVFSLGAFLQGEYHFAHHFSVFASAGYTGIFTSDGSDHLDLIPIQAGPRVYFTKKFFLGAGLGYTIISEKGERTEVFNYRPHVGIDGRKWQGTLGYNALTKYGDNVRTIDLTIVLKF